MDEQVSVTYVAAPAVGAEGEPICSEACGALFGWNPGATWPGYCCISRQQSQPGWQCFPDARRLFKIARAKGG